MGDLKGTILVVDDEPEIREIIELYASDLGLDVLEACDGKQAYEIINEHHIDVVVSDLQMPRMSGISFLEAIRDDGFNTPFIFVTAHPSRDSTVHALRLGAFDYLEKPFEKEQLQTLISEALRVSLEQQKIVESTKKDESFAESQPDEAQLAIIKMRTLRYQENDGNAKNDHSKRKIKELFVEEAEPQLMFCKASIEALTDVDNRSWELGYLLRVMKAVNIAAEAINEPALAETLAAAERCYTYLRIKPRSVTDKVLKVLRASHTAITYMVNRLTIEGTELEAPKDVVRLLNQIADNTSNEASIEHTRGKTNKQI